MQRVSNVLRFIWRSTRRIVVVVVGAALLAGGLIMLVTPGPGIVLIIAGLAVLATEFVWAERMLDAAKARAAGAADRVRRRRRSGDDGDVRSPAVTPAPAAGTGASQVDTAAAEASPNADA